MQGKDALLPVDIPWISWQKSTFKITCLIINFFFFKKKHKSQTTNPFRFWHQKEEGASHDPTNGLADIVYRFTGVYLAHGFDFR